MCFGCHELVNAKRTYTYIQWACSNGMFESECQPNVSDCGCPDDNTGFVDPVADSVCWYDPAIPASSEFLGLWIVGLTGLWDSPFSQSMTDTVGKGVTIGRPRWAGKEAHFDAMVFATSERGMDYGLEYLRRTLESPDNGCADASQCQTGGCGTRSMRIRAFCPQPGDPDDGIREFLHVGTIDGLKVTDQDKRNKCCNTMRAVSFTLASERPESYSLQGNCIDEDASNAFVQCWDWNAACDGNSIRCVECMTCNDITFCGQIDCDVCEQCVGCAYQSTIYTAPPDPPTVIKDCYSFPLEWAVQCCCPDPESQPTVRDSTYRIEIFSGHGLAPTIGLRDLRLLFFDNILNFDCADTSQEAYDQWSDYSPCAELHIKAIPPDTTLIIDGRTRTINAICKNVCLPADSLVFNACGGSVFPLVSSCSPKMICAEWALQTTPFVENISVFPAHIKVDIYNVHA